MQTLLLICDDETRRAELHRLLLSDFEVYATDHASSAAMRKDLGKKDVIVVEQEGLDEDGKISVYPVRGEAHRFIKVIRSLLKLDHSK